MAEDSEQSPFTRPGFVASALIVAAVVILGLVVVIVNMTGNSDNSSEPAPTTIPTDDVPTDSPPATGAPTPDPADESSVCGLEGVVLEGTVSTPLSAEWRYDDMLAWPLSEEYGPGVVEPDGIRYCFQRSPEGAVFAATNASIQGGNPDFETVQAWLNYFVAEGPLREAALPDDPDEPTEAQGMRITVEGFRLLAYDGDSARVDVGLRATMGNETAYLSMVYDLVWQAGDWKLRVTDPENVINVAGLPNLSGYVPWERDF